MKTITPEEAHVLAQEKKCIFVDVRSPKEFQHSHILNAVSFPVIDDLERHEVGLLYKTIGKEQAVEKGWSFLLPRLSTYIESIKEKIKKNNQNNNQINHTIIYCARGGLRSSIVQQILAKENINTLQLEGGFKEYMHFIHNQLKEIGDKVKQKKFIALSGKTGAGKTAILQELKKKGYAILDLEGLCKHRSSVFGGINLKPRTQKMFLINLLYTLNQLINADQEYIFIEYESSRIGNICLPHFVIEILKKAEVIEIQRSPEVRANHILAEYFTDPEEIKKMYALVLQIESLLGKMNVQLLHLYLDNKEYFKFSLFLLTDYYDIRYKLPSQKPAKIIKEEQIDNIVKQIKLFVEHEYS